MDRKIALAIAMLAVTLLTLPTFGKDEKHTNSKPRLEPAEQPGIQVRVQPRAFAIGGALNSPSGWTRFPSRYVGFRHSETLKWPRNSN